MELRGMNEPLLLSSSVEVAAPLPPTLTGPSPNLDGGASARSAAAAATPRSNAARRRLHAAVLGVQITQSLASGQRGRRRNGTVQSRELAAAPLEPTADPESQLRRQRTQTSIDRQHNAASHVEDAFLGEVDDDFKRPWLQMAYSRLLWLVRATMLV